MEKVLVAGANGTTGKKIVQLLKQSQYFEPVAMVRKKEQQQQFENDGVKTVLADLEKDLSHAVKGIDKVVFAAGSGGGTSEEKTTLVDQEGAKRLVDVSKLAAVKKFVMLSSMGADNPSENEDLEHYLQAKQNADAHLQASGLNYAIVRPGTLNDNDGTGKIALRKKFEKFSEITRQDVAATLVAVLNDDVANKVTFEILQGDTLIGKAVDKFDA